nr:hypothetical protein [Tanacetum cinerariifolium]
MAAGLRDRPSMLAKRQYPQWRSRFLRYIDTILNGEALRKCILSGSYKPTTILVQVVAATDDSPAIPEHTTEMKYTRLLMLAKQLRKCGKLSKGYNKKQFDCCYDASQCSISSTTSARMVKQYQKEVNELRAKRLARNANPLALVATAQANQDTYYQTSKSHKSYATSSKSSIPTRTHTTTRYNSKEIAKPITPPSETAFEEDSDPKQAQRDKDMQKNLALIVKYFKKIYKPTNNNLRTSSKSRKKNVDTTPWYKNDNQSRQFGNQRTLNVAGAREIKPKMVKDSAYHKEKMLLYKQAKQGVPLQAEQYDWLADTDEEIDEQELEAHYSYMAKIQEVPTADSSTDSEPLEQVQNDTEYNVFANDLRHSEKSKSISNTCLLETDDSNVIPNSLDMCEDDIQNDQKEVESDDERVTLANLIANLKLDVDENKKIPKKLKKANTIVPQELKECKTILAKTSKTLGESNSVRDSCLVSLQNKQTEFEKYKAFNDRTIDYDKLERKLNETLGQLAQKDIEIKEGLKTKACEISVVKEKHNELIKQSLLTKSHYEGKLREEHDIDKMLSMEKQLKFLNEIVYKRSQSIQTIHMMAPKVPTCNGRPTFANPRYLKQAQSEIPCLYAFPYDQSTHANRLILDGKETLALERESRSKLNKDLVRPYDFTTLNSLYEIFKPPTQKYEIQLAHVNEIRRKMWRKPFVKYKPNIYKNVGFLLVSKSISKSGQAYNAMTNNINHFKEFVDNAWIKHSKDQFRAPTAQDMEILIQTCLMPLAIKTQNDSFIFVHELKQEMHADLNELKKLTEKGKGKSMDTKFDKPFVVRQPNAQRIPKPSVLEDLSKPVTAQTLPQTARQAVSNTNVLKPGMYRIDNRKTQTRAPQLTQTVRNTNPRVSTFTRVNHKTNVSRPQHKSNQLKDKVLPNNSQVKPKKTQVEEH